MTRRNVLVTLAYTENTQDSDFEIATEAEIISVPQLYATLDQQIS